MKHSMNPLTIASALACLSLIACHERTEEESAPAQEESTSAEAPADLQKKIFDLQRRIEAREQTIEDLNAMVAMERDKLDDNPDYDSPILHEVLLEQEQERLEIENARKQLKSLTR